jgi:Cu(I)/Ag(I) efflux system membrane fusion protein
MKNLYGIFVTMLLLLGVAAGGYWLGLRNSAPEAPIAKAERKPLYYRNPMGLPDTSPVPKKDAMGMDYVPVYEGEEPASSTVISIGSDKVQKLGVKSEAAALRTLDLTLRAVGRIEVDERRTYAVAPKFEGWVERLYVNTTGQSVAKGQPLFDVYSPELVSAQREHVLALQGVAALKDADGEAQDSMRQLADASAARLRNWGVSGRASGGRAQTFHAPVSGVVLEKIAVQGMRFMPGETLYRIADLSAVWVVADVAEQDIARIKVGDAVRIAVDAWPEQRFDGKVDFVYPALDGATRTTPVRIALANPQGQLKPAMFASVEFSLGKGEQVLAIPASAVIDSGARQVALVRLDEGRFEPRELRLGRRGDDYVEVLNGIAEGEQVVTSANFLIDAESNLRAALSGMGAPVRQTDGTTSHSTKPASGQVAGYQGGHAAHGGAPTGEPVTAKKEEPAAATPTRKKPVSVGHLAQGTLEAINADGTVSIAHEPIESLGWPGMTMDFALANSSLVTGIQPGSAISFEIVERKPDEWVITKLQVRVQQQHEGH